MRDSPPILVRGEVYPKDGKKVARYKVLGKIGAGDFSQVWLARDLQSKTQPFVAIKCLSPPVAAHVIPEVEVLRRIRDDIPSSSHPGARHVVVLLDDFVVTAPGQTTVRHQCLVTELLLGWHEDCFDFMNKAPLMRQIVDAFNYIHSLGVVHGDPHYGNFAITLGSLQNVPERAIDETLASCNVWQTTLRRLSRDKSINCGDLYPEEAVHMHIKVIDFGRAYIVKPGDRVGKPDRELTERNPHSLRSPEVDIFHISQGTAGAHWSFGCDVYSLGCILWGIARQVPLFPNSPDCEPNTEELVLRCIPGGPPPEEWLQYCGKGSALITRLKQLGCQVSEVPADSQNTVDNPDWVVEEMARQKRKHWKDISAPTQRENAIFPYAEFADMVQRTLSFDARKRASMVEVVEHGFWRRFDPYACDPDLYTW